ncbi:MAG TPA: hypothetical protein VK483_17210 [Chitinophagaceae bacterium]|nr:hypothetical protein [Chitinophagaceae bacterium]
MLLSKPSEQAITNKRIEEDITPAIGGANTQRQAQHQLRLKKDELNTNCGLNEFNPFFQAGKKVVSSFSRKFF